MIAKAALEAGSPAIELSLALAGGHAFHAGGQHRVKFFQLDHPRLDPRRLGGLGERQSLPAVQCIELLESPRIQPVRDGRIAMGHDQGEASVVVRCHLRIVKATLPIPILDASIPYIV
jgi:hypothetical protein